MTSLSPILGKWTKLGNNITTCRTDTKIGIWSILKVGNPKLKSLFRYFQNFTIRCDVIIPNFGEMDQSREQRNYLSDRHQNWYLDHFKGEKSKNGVTFRNFPNEISFLDFPSSKCSKYQFWCLSDH